MTTSTERDRQIQQLHSLIQDIDCGMFTTVDTDGSLHSCPMFSNGEVDADGTIWFFTHTNSRRATEVEQHQQVNVSFSSSQKQRYISISGTAQLIKDHKKVAELWNPELQTWFPKGLDEPDLALIKVNIKKADYWDSRSSYHPQTISFSDSFTRG